MKEFISFVSFPDVIEIGIIFMLISIPLVWLAKTTRHALEIIYLAMALHALCVYYPFPALQSVIYAIFPCVLVSILLTHRQILQRSYLVATMSAPSINWIELCVKFFIQAQSDTLYSYCIIEADQSLESFLQASPMMHLVINQDVLELINYHSAHTLWITKQGILRSTRAVINAESSVNNSSLHTLLCTMALQTGCCILIKKNDGSLSLMYGNNLVEQITPRAIVRYIKHHVQQSFDESTYDKKIYKEDSL